VRIFDDYKQQVIDFYDRRSDYDNDFTRRRALRLIDEIALQNDQTVLDVATGTGFVAIALAGKVKQVIGVDFTPEMILRARQKVTAEKVLNLELIEADIEEIDWSEGSFDLITCSMAIALFRDIPKILHKWYRWLKIGGAIAFSCNNEDSHFMPLIDRVCQNTYGFPLPNLHTPIGTPEKCRQLLQNAGFGDISVRIEQLGQYLSLETARGFWKGQYFHPVDNPLSRLSSAEIETLIERYQAEIERNVTDRGIWQDMTTFFVTASKP
jgi:arsenite methyltransferase